MKFWKEMNLPNKLTIIRMALIPLFILCFYLPVRWWNIVAAVIFVAAYATDTFDGYYARKYNLVTDFGKLMDPMADKMLTTSALIMLVYKSMLSPIPALIIILREFVISGCRLVWAGKGNVVAANWIGKMKTVTQFIAIALILLHDPLIEAIGFPLDMIVLWISVVLAVWSMLDYIRKNNK